MVEPLGTNMFRIYYHMYLGLSWRQVWSIHRPQLEVFARSGLLDRLIICVYGEPAHEVIIEPTERVEVAHLSRDLSGVNEFPTLERMRRDALDPELVFDYCVYMHSKGSSAKALSPAAEEWSRFLSTATIGSLPSFGGIVEDGFNSAGSNLALGLFEDFCPPRLHYSGNFWCATRGLVASARDIDLGSRYASVRHNAEWWLSTASEFAPFNVFSTGLDHYSEPRGVVDWERLDARLDQISRCRSLPNDELKRIAFMAKMIARATGSHPLLRRFSNMLLSILPYHHWRRFLNLHDVVMRNLGSRKSVYFYCRESQ